MGKVRKHIRNLHDGTENGERIFDAIVEEGRVTIELKISKKQLVQVPWEDIVTQVDAAKYTACVILLSVIFVYPFLLSFIQCDLVRG